MPLLSSSAMSPKVQAPPVTPLFATSTNVPMSLGVVTAGYFAAGFDVNASLSDWAALVANFTPVASGTPGSFSDTLAGSSNHL